MDQLLFKDTLEVLGLSVGVLLVIGGLATLSGAPWATMSDTTAAAGQVFGALVAIAIGIVLALVSRSNTDVS